MLVTAANDLKVSHWPYIDQLDAFNMKGDEIISVSWSKNNAFMIYLERNGRPQILSLKDRRNIKVIHVVTAIDHASTVLFSRSRNGTVAIGTTQGTVALYDTHSKTIMQLYDVPGPVFGVDFNCYDKYLGVTCQAGQVVIMDLATHKPIFNADIQEPSSGIRFHPFYADNFGICTGNGKFIYMDLNQNEPIWAVTVALKALNGFAFYPKEDIQQVVTVDEEYKVSTYETLTGRCLFRCCLQQPLTAIDYSQDGKFYGVAMANGSVCLFDTGNPRTPATILDIHENRRIHCLRFSNMLCTQAEATTCPTGSQLSCDSRGTTTLRPFTVNGTELSPETIRSLLSQDSVALLLQNVKDDIDIHVKKYVMYFKSHVKNQLNAFDDFIRREFQKIEEQVQEKWEVLKLMNLSANTDRMLTDGADSDDIDEDLQEDDPTTRGTHDDIVILE
ncbi:uncharacterized protein [Atheta coriaria]|uniref:uncharacterized protein n=1 Tax=Dalotia coriaria TaxID=877792 RepID=UPI0031F3B567